VADSGAESSGDAVPRSARLVELEESWEWALLSSNKMSDLSAVFFAHRARQMRVISYGQLA